MFFNKVYDSNTLKPMNIVESTQHFFRKPIVSKICFGLTILISFILVYGLNRLHPLFGDDWIYSMLPLSDDRISSFYDILHSQYEHYFTWGGRSIVHIIAQSLLLLGTPSAKVFNSIAYVCFTLIIYYIANKQNKLRPSLLICINLLIWFCQPAWGSTILWITGSANYLWGTLIVFLFFIPFINYLYRDKSEKDHIIKSIAMFVFGILAGWTNENMAIALIAILVLFFYYYKKNIKQIPRWAIFALGGVVIGAVIMILAPGNYARIDSITHNSNFINRYFGQFITALKSYYFYAFNITFVLLLILIIYKYLGNKMYKKTILFCAFTFSVGAIIATLAMSASPIFPGRASFGIISLLILSVSILIANLDFTQTFVRQLLYISIIFFLLIFIREYKQAYFTLEDVNKKLEKRIQFVEKGKQEGVYNFVFNDRIVVDNRFLHFFELSFDSTNWHNQTFCKYYHINSIVVK